MRIRRRTVPAGVPSVALADIAFNLILFFIILAKTQDDSHLRWQPARAPGALTAAPDARFSVTVDVDKTVHLNGDPVGVADIAPRLEAGLGATPAGQRFVLLKVEKETPAQVFEPIIEAVSQAGGDLVHVLERER